MANENVHHSIANLLFYETVCELVYWGNDRLQNSPYFYDSSKNGCGVQNERSGASIKKESETGVRVPDSISVLRTSRAVI